MRSRPRFYDIAGRILWEGAARRAGMGLQAELVGQPVRPQYRFAVDTPVYDDQRLVTVTPRSPRSHEDPVVFIDGQPCLRHRWPDGSLCMWLDSDPPEMRWVAADGFLALVGHIEQHAWCEAVCRTGQPWPKPESPGSHPRKADCASCLGRGA